MIELNNLRLPGVGLAPIQVATYRNELSARPVADALYDAHHRSSTTGTGHPVADRTTRSPQQHAPRVRPLRPGRLATAACTGQPAEG